MLLFQLSEATAAQRRVPIHLVDATDGITPETGEATGQPQISKNGGAFANTTATLTSIGNGAYYVELTATELNTVGFIVVRFKSANTAEAQVAGQVVSFDPYDAVRAGLTALPNANAEAAGGLYTRGSGAGQINQDANGRVDTRTSAMASAVLTATAIATDAITAVKIATGAITSSKFASGAIDAAAFAQGAADKVWSSATRTLTAFSTALAVSIWDVLESAVLTASSIGLKVKNNLDAAITSRQPSGAVDLNADQSGVTVGTVNALGTTAKADVNAEVDAALDTAIPGVPTADSINERVKAIDDKLPTGTISDFDETADNVTVDTNNDKTGYRLSATGVDDVLDEAYEGTTTLRQFLRLAASALFGKLSGAATTNVLIRDEADTKNRINATVDADGNRSAVTLDKT